MHGARFFLVMSNDRTRDRNWNTGSFPSEHEKNLYFKSDRPLEKADQRGCGVFSGDIKKTCLDAFMCNLL